MGQCLFRSAASRKLGLKKCIPSCITTSIGNQVILWTVLFCVWNRQGEEEGSHAYNFATACIVKVKHQQSQGRKTIRVPSIYCQHHVLRLRTTRIRYRWPEKELESGKPHRFDRKRLIQIFFSGICVKLLAEPVFSCICQSCKANR